MEVFTDLLPPSYTAKAEPSAKDSNKHQQQKKSKQKQIVKLVAEQEPSDINLYVLTGEDRRTGDDRRQNQINRGRWLESRSRSDRRASESTIFVRV